MILDYVYDSSLGYNSADALLFCVVRGCEWRLSAAEGVLSNAVSFQQSILKEIGQQA
jgi:hypothetical protein